MTYEVWVKQAYHRGRWVVVHNSKEAADVCRTYIEGQNETGEYLGSEWEGGDVRRAGERKTFARVSYNGRVWDSRPYPLCQPMRF